jgi:hypothetical protein
MPQLPSELSPNVPSRQYGDEVLRTVVATGRLDEPGRGIAFVLSVDEVRGIVHRDASL